MAIFYQLALPQGANYLTEEESRHCVKVLRKRLGDVITIVDGLGNYYEASITDANPKKCTFEVLGKYQQPTENYSITLLIAPTKNLDRTEWMVEKLTEVGVNTIQFILCKHSERKVLKLDRLVRKAISAMKQSSRAQLPQLLPMIHLTSWQESITANSQKFIAYIDENVSIRLAQSAKPARNYIVLVGPEGDFTAEEVAWAMQHEFQPVSLGSYRLRTETAGLVAVHTLHTINQLK